MTREQHNLVMASEHYSRVHSNYNEYARFGQCPQVLRFHVELYHEATANLDAAVLAYAKARGLL